MAGHELIAAQLAILAHRLPAQAVEELADGLQEAYEAHLATLGDPDAAARAAIAEFGDAEVITTAFVRDSPWRRTAMALLATGPIMALVWGLTLVSARMWTWPIVPPLRIAYGLALAATVFTLLSVVREKHAYRRAQAATPVAAVTLILLDAGMLAAAVASMPPLPWPMALAAPASLIRIILTVRALPPLLQGR
ncbi:hypothetical protein [Nonomuraea turcica]|uniref:hypothetical protein n=1 Tax=Nonomuraea sp. G32 TaxID=3067274 RepID=UPI00273B69A6|nr:hypothetical protein [Nonomuraea sp. G32]MDP4510048.1 hypothetical protein [Nonomuraea sp. G32]